MIHPCLTCGSFQVKAETYLADEAFVIVPKQSEEHEGQPWLCLKPGCPRFWRKPKKQGLSGAIVEDDNGEY